MKPKRKRLHDQGDVVLLDFPGAQITKRRPAVVLSSAQYHSECRDAIVGLITSQLNRANSATDHLLEDWKEAGLTQPSAYRTFLATIPRSAINRHIGRLSTRDLRSVRKCLQIGLSL
jgi:mRNA interferase MazF